MNQSAAQARVALVEAETGHFDDAAAYYRRALELNPQYGPVYYNLAMELATEGNLRDAYFT
jgi:Flp pilus assembly protein TadD